MRSSRGFSLIGMLVALGLVSVGTTAFVHLLTTSQRSQRQITSLSELDDLKNLLNAYYVKREFCEATFKGRTFDPTESTLSDQTIPNSSDSAPLIIHRPGLGRVVLAEVGMYPVPGLSLTQLELNDFVSTAAHSYVARLEFRGKFKSGLEIIRKLSLALETENLSSTSERIVSCHSLPLGTGAPSTGSPGSPGSPGSSSDYLGSSVRFYKTTSSGVTVPDASWCSGSLSSGRCALNQLVIPVEIPKGSKRVKINLIGHNLQTYVYPDRDWSEVTEDSMLGEIIVDLVSEISTGMYSVIGGSGANNTALFGWEKRPFSAADISTTVPEGDPSRVIGDTSTTSSWGTDDAANFKLHLVSEGGTLKVSGVPQYIPGQYLWKYEFYGSP